MLTVIATPFGGLLELFVLLPLGILASICGADCADALRRRPRRAGRG